MAPVGTKGGLCADPGSGSMLLGVCFWPMHTPPKYRPFDGYPRLLGPTVCSVGETQFWTPSKAARRPLLCGV